MVSEGWLQSSPVASYGDPERVIDLIKASVTSSAKCLPRRIVVSIKCDNTGKTFSNLTHNKCTVLVSIFLIEK